MSVTTGTRVLASPFPGLRPFMHDEADLFFGRDRQSDELVRRLALNRFLAVLGTSGSGKSSLVRAGLLPALEGGFMASAGAHWSVAILRPQDDPIGFLARALVEAGVLPSLGLPGAAAEGIVETTLRRSSLGLVDVARLARLEPHQNLLILVDQFEELFRFADLAKERGTEDEAKAFVKLLLAAAQQTDVPVYVLITMRSDFLGDCDRFSGLPEAITDSPYLTPRLTRDELQAAITGPVGVHGGRIAPALVQRLLNDVGDDPDQLPILQHALMRAWDHRQHDNPDARPIDLSDLDAIGGLAEALSRHAEEAFASLTSDRERIIAERLFKCLTEKGPDNRELRRPTPLSRVAGIASADVPDVVAVIDVFRAPGRSFLMPPYGVELNGDSVVDISHESLIRQWWRLREWVAEEAESVTRYRRLAESADLHARGAAGLLIDPELTNMLAWQDHEQPNDPWAERYDPELERALAFLEESEQARELAEAERRRARRRKRLIPIVGVTSAVIVAILIAFTVFAINQRNTANQLRRTAEQRDGVVLAAVRVQNRARVAQGTLNGYLTCTQPGSGESTGICPPHLEKAISFQRKRVAQLARDGERGSAAIAAISVGGSLIPTNSIRSDDLFDVNRGTGDFSSSGYNLPAMFGRTSGAPENAGMLRDTLYPKSGPQIVTFFKDGLPVNYPHWIAWKTKGDVELRSVGLFARHDDVLAGFGAGDFTFRRAFKTFELDAREGGRWVPLVKYSPTLPYGGGSTGSSLAVCLPIPATSAQEFKAVFVQAVDILHQFSAPRVVALDGNSKSCAQQYPTH